ncbi:MAG: PDDEXK nuclease domain-containing protein [Bacteroidales bacterium]
MNFDKLTDTVIFVNDSLQAKAKSAVNVALTIRNWLIGYYIVEFEQNGEDRATYGSELLKNLSKNITKREIDGFSVTNLKLFRQFYSNFPEIALLFNKRTDNQILLSISDDLKKAGISIGQSTTDQLNNNVQSISQLATDQSQSSHNQLDNDSLLKLSSKMLQSLSFTHISLLLGIDDKLKRSFYVVEAIKGVWSVKELKRQIDSLYFERSGLSKDKLTLSKLTAQNAHKDTNTIRNPMIFEFLSLPTNETIHEAQLEKGLMDNLQHFLLELGYGFCFEARQKRILIDDEYYFIDLVFYHRVLKCHVLIELKTEAFTHENIGQLNIYLHYFKDKIMLPDDNPPIGILLCTKAKSQMVRYATTNKDNVLVNEYRVQLPDEKELQRFVEQQLNNL